jgi:hypothetical protein
MSFIHTVKIILIYGVFHNRTYMISEHAEFRLKKTRSISVSLAPNLNDFAQQ